LHYENKQIYYSREYSAIDKIIEIEILIVLGENLMITVKQNKSTYNTYLLIIILLTDIYRNYYKSLNQ